MPDTETQLITGTITRDLFQLPTVAYSRMLIESAPSEPDAEGREVELVIFDAALAATFNGAYSNGTHARLLGWGNRNPRTGAPQFVVTGVPDHDSLWTSDQLAEAGAE